MIDPQQDISSLKNIGPYMVRIMNNIGIYTIGDLLSHDYLQIRDKMIEKGITPHILMFYSIDMGLQNRKWSDISPTEKLELRRILDMKTQA
jgi:hypothetical protein